MADRGYEALSQLVERLDRAHVAQDRRHACSAPGLWWRGCETAGQTLRPAGCIAHVQGSVGDRLACRDDLKEWAAGRIVNTQPGAVEDIGTTPPDRLRAGPRDQLLSGGIEAKEATQLVHLDDRIGRALDDRSQLLALAVEHLSELGAAEGHGKLVPRELDHAQALGIERAAFGCAGKDSDWRFVTQPEDRPAARGRAHLCDGRDAARLPEYLVIRKRPKGGNQSQAIGRRPLEPDCTRARLGQAHQLDQHHPGELLEAGARRKELAQLVLGEHRVRLPLRLLHDLAAIRLEGRDPVEQFPVGHGHFPGIMARVRR